MRELIYGGMEEWGKVQTDWTRIAEDTKRELRVSGLAAYKISEENVPLRDLDTIIAYVHPKADLDLPEGEENTLSIISSGDRPAASRHQDEFGHKFGVVCPDVYYSDLIEGNERYFRKELVENEEFRENVIQTVSDQFYTEIFDQYSPIFDYPEKLERF